MVFVLVDWAYSVCDEASTRGFFAAEEKKLSRVRLDILKSKISLQRIHWQVLEILGHEAVDFAR